MKINIHDKCHYYMSISISRKQVYEVYCCRAFNTLDKRKDFYWVNEHIDDYLKEAIGMPFVMNERFPLGYCIKTHQAKICNDRFVPNELNGISLGTLTRCNYSCPCCAVRDNGKSELTIEEEISFTEKLLLALSKYKNINQIQISNSGEISTYSEGYLKRLANAIINNGNIKFVDVLSNGSNYKSLNQFESLLRDNGVDSELHLSFYSLNENTYERLTGSRSLDKVIECVQKTKFKHKCLGFILFKENMEELDDVIQFAKDNGYSVYVSANMYDVDMHREIKNVYDKYGNTGYIYIEGFAKNQTRNFL